MIINRKNYETYALDFLDGSLSEVLQAEFQSFLYKNPDIARELEDLEPFHLEANLTIKYPSKENLKKRAIISSGAINKENYKTFLIASLEGDLSDDEKRDLIRFISLNPDLKEIHNSFRNTKLQPDFSITYPDKEKLKKNAAPIYLKRSFIALAAAVIVLLFGISWVFLNLKQETNIHSGPLTSLSNGVEKQDLIIQYEKAALTNLNYRGQLASLPPVRKNNIYDGQKAPAAKEYPIQKIPIQDNDDIFIIPADIFDGINTQRRSFNKEALMANMEAQQNDRGKNNRASLLALASDRLSKFLSEKTRTNNTKFTFWDLARAGIKSIAMAGKKTINYKEKQEDNKNIKSIRTDAFEYYQSKSLDERLPATQLSE